MFCAGNSRDYKVLRQISFELTRQEWSIAGSLFAMESRICRARCFAISSRFGDSVVSSYCEKRLSSPKPMIL